MSRPVTPPDLEPDCSKCAALCCAVFAFDKSESFGIDKAAGEVCPNLNQDNGCAIFSARADLGFQGCITYTCFGAGQRVTQDVFDGRNWRDDPKLMHRMGDALSVLRRIHEQLVLLTAARNLPLSADRLKELQEFEARLTPVETWNEAELADYPIDRICDEIRTWLMQLRRLVS